MVKKIKRFGIFIFIAILFAVAFNYINKSSFHLESPIRGTFDIIEQFEKRINNPPPLKFESEYKISSNLTTGGILESTNQMRKENGNLSLLSENHKLDVIAQKRLDDMFEKQYFEHISPSGASVSDVAKENGYDYIMIGENIALGNFQNDKSLVQAWMDSPGHRANILNGRYMEIGLAIQKGSYEDRETWMAIQVFAIPLWACPAIDNALKQQIDANNNRIVTLEKSAAEIKSSLESSKRRSIDEIAVYNENVDKYNELVFETNALFKQTKDLIAKYNSEVEAFNECAKN